MSDSTIVLNLGVGGDTTDASAVTDPTGTITVPIKRERVVIGGDEARAEVLNLIKRNGAYRLPTYDEFLLREQWKHRKLLQEILRKDLPRGQRVSAASIPVTIASDQDTLAVAETATSRATYSASSPALAINNASTDIAVLVGPTNGKILKVTRFVVAGAQTTANYVNFLVVRRSVPNSGGTPSNTSAVPHDSKSPASTAVLQTYTTNTAVLGAGVTVLTQRCFLPTALLYSPCLVWEASRPAQAFILRTQSESLAINLGISGTTAAQVSVSFEWTEE